MARQSPASASDYFEVRSKSCIASTAGGLLKSYSPEFYCPALISACESTIAKCSRADKRTDGLWDVALCTAEHAYDTLRKAREIYADEIRATYLAANFWPGSLPRNGRRPRLEAASFPPILLSESVMKRIRQCPFAGLPTLQTSRSSSRGELYPNARSGV